MTQREESNTVAGKFVITARGGQWWEWADVEVIAGRATITVDDDTDNALALTRIQTEELAAWLARELDR